MALRTETKIEPLQRESGTPCFYGLYLGFSREVTVHCFLVPGVDESQVMVTAIKRDNTDNNLLKRPAALLYLNRLLQWFDWTSLWGIKIQLAQEANLCMQVTRPIERSLLDQRLDEAYRAWLKKHPGGSAEAWSSYALNHVKDGRLECAVNGCHEPAVLGTDCCHEHQEFA